LWNENLDKSFRSSQFSRLTDRQRDGQTDSFLIVVRQKVQFTWRKSATKFPSEKTSETKF